MSQYTIISKYGKRTHQLKIKKERKKKETTAASENRFTLELNEKGVIELLDNTTLGSTKKAAKCGMKIIQGKNLKTLF